MKRIIDWYLYKASIKSKLLICIGFMQGIVLVFFSIYANSMAMMVIKRVADSEEEVALLTEKYKPAFIVCVLMAIVLVALSLLLAAIISSSPVNRIKKLSRDAKDLANGDLDYIPETDATDEIGDVVNSISHMAVTLHEKVKEATEANSAKTNFLARMSHDIRTPMNAIKGMVEIIKKNSNDTGRVDNCIKKIEISTNHLLTLIDEILDMSKLEGNELELTNDSFDISEVLDDAYGFAIDEGAERDIRVYMDKSEITTTKIIGCELYTKRIFTNIISNAIKFNKDNGSISIDASENVIDKHRVVYTFAIEDSGVGMSKEFEEKAFEPFSEENSGARSEYRGTGLGLSIVKKLVDAMGGKITVESELGIGTTVTFTLPFYIDSDFDAVEEERVDNMAGDIVGSHMLLVEDNELNLEIAKFMLEDKGIIVDTAVNGLEAVKKFDKSIPFTYDLILMDIMMPELDGIEASKRIRDLSRADAKLVPIVALSANTYAEDIKASKDAGMNDHLAKPIDPEKLYDVITKQKKLYDARRIEKPYSQLFTGEDLL